MRSCSSTDGHTGGQLGRAAEGRLLREASPTPLLRCSGRNSAAIHTEPSWATRSDASLSEVAVGIVVAGGEGPTVAVSNVTAEAVRILLRRETCTIGRLVT